MTDKELIQRLIANDPKTIYNFFFVRCRGMLSYVGAFYGCSGLPEELIGEFYEFLSADDWHKLRIFKHTCSLNAYVSIIATRYFQRRRKHDLLSLDDDTVRIRPTATAAQSEGFLHDDILAIASRMSPLDRMLICRILLDGDKPMDVLNDVREFIPKDKLKTYTKKQLAAYVYTRYNRVKNALQQELTAMGYNKN
ncbi:MAG: hypothetical protein J6Q93_05030 [Prevotella sp.]|nr:hypothetical protein [Prevotella sp.]